MSEPSADLAEDPVRRLHWESKPDFVYRGENHSDAWELVLEAPSALASAYALGMKARVSIVFLPTLGPVQFLSEGIGPGQKCFDLNSGVLFPDPKVSAEYNQSLKANLEVSSMRVQSEAAIQPFQRLSKTPEDLTQYFREVEDLSVRRRAGDLNGPQTEKPVFPSFRITERPHRSPSALSEAEPSWIQLRRGVILPVYTERGLEMVRVLSEQPARQPAERLFAAEVLDPIRNGMRMAESNPARTLSFWVDGRLYVHAEGYSTLLLPPPHEGNSEFRSSGIVEMKASDGQVTETQKATDEWIELKDFRIAEFVFPKAFALRNLAAKELGESMPEVGKMGAVFVPGRGFIFWGNTNEGSTSYALNRGAYELDRNTEEGRPRGTYSSVQRNIQRAVGEALNPDFRAYESGQEGRGNFRPGEDKPEKDGKSGARVKKVRPKRGNDNGAHGVGFRIYDSSRFTDCVFSDSGKRCRKRTREARRRSGLDHAQVGNDSSPLHR